MVRVAAEEGDTTWYISSRGEDSATCGETAESACRSLDPIWERIQGLKPPCEQFNISQVGDFIENCMFGLISDDEISQSQNDSRTCKNHEKNTLLWKEMFQNITDYALHFGNQQCLSVVGDFVVQMKNTMTLGWMCWLIEEEVNLHNVVDKTLSFIQPLLKDVSVTVITDRSFIVNSTVQSAPSNKTVHVQLVPRRNEAIEVILVNSTLNRIYYHVDHRVTELNIRDCTFIGSGLKVNSFSAFIVITNSLFYHSHQPALEVFGGTNITITDSKFFDNYGLNGAVLFFGTHAEVSNSTFVRNYGFAGAVMGFESSTSCFYCFFESNIALIDGGAINACNASVELSKTSMTNNIAVWRGAGLCIQSNATASLQNCFIGNNSAD